MDKPEKQNVFHEVLRQLGHVSTMAAAMVFSTFAGVWFGYYLDTKVFENRTHPWFTIIFFLFGLAGGIRNLFILGKRMKRQEEEREKAAKMKGIPKKENTK